MHTTPSGPPLFREEQPSWHQPIALILLPAGLFVMGVAIYAFIYQIIGGKPFGGDPMSDNVLMGFLVLYFVLGLLMVVLFFTARLITEVRHEGVFVRYIPFHRTVRHYRPDEIADYEVVTYRPIRDFGGWGVRFGLKGLAYNVSGNRGVQLQFRNGRRLLIGSRHPEAMAEALRSIASV